MPNSALYPLLFAAVLTLSACSSDHEPLKSPCPPLSGLFGSPCDVSPLNILEYKEDLVSWIR